MDFHYIICFLACLLPSSLGQNPTVDVQPMALDFEIKINPPNQDQQFKIDESRILTCSSSATADGQKPVLHWEINGVKVTATTKDDRIYVEDFAGNLLLRVTSVQDGDQGTYTCVGTLAGQTDTRNIEVEVYKALEVISDEDQFGILNQDGEVMCEAVGKPTPTISWKFDDGTIIQNNDKYIVQPNKLIIKNLQFEDDRTYLCDIIVIQTGMSKPFYITYEVVQVPVIPLPPTIQPNNPKVGDEVKITCIAEGVPPPKYQFRRSGNLLPEAQVDEVNGILTIPDLKREDEALYTCVASNRGGSAEKSNTLDVKIPPIIRDIADITDAVEGGIETVTCMAEGDPEPTVTWKKEGHTAYTDGIRDDGPEIISEGGNDRPEAEIKVVGKTMKFDSVKPQDAGTYICTAFNVVGNASKSIKFEVKYPPHFDTDFKETIFYGWAGHTANLTCQASANELAMITWYEPDPNAPTDISQARQISTENPFTVNTMQRFGEYHLSSRSLMIYISGEDNSLYKDYLCGAVNSLSQEPSVHTVTLKEALPPGAPEVRVGSILSTMVTLEVDTPAQNGGQEVTGYKYSYYPADNAASVTDKTAERTGETTRIELMNLNPATSYVVRVAATNVVGAGSQMPISFDTKIVSKPLKLVFMSPQEGTEPTSYTVQWAEPDDGGSPITQYIVKYKKVAVEGNDPSAWKIVEDIDSDFTVQRVDGASTRRYTMRGLTRDSYYDVRITAVNQEGESDEEFRIVKTSKGGGTPSKAGSAGLGSGAVIGIIIGLIVLILLVVVILYFVFKKKPELVGRLRGRLGGKGGEEERGKNEDGKDPAEEEKLIKKDDTVKVENETGEGKTDQVIEEHQEEFEPDSKPEPQAAPEAAKEGAAEKPQDLTTPAPTTEIKITPETPEKPESPPA